IINQYAFLKELKMCLHELSLVDDTMEAVGSPKKYQWLRKWIIRIIIGYIVYMFHQFATCIYTTFIIEDQNIIKNFDVICVSYLFNYGEYIYVLSVLIWGTILGYISFSFHQVNDRLHVLCSDLSENIAEYRKKDRSILVCQQIIEAEERKQYIWIIM
ncbi:hypothetical protein ALC56_07492, partial [Trachymyrmex septentrionalis]